MMGALLPWLPLLFIFLVMVFFARRQSQSYAQHVEEVNAVNREIVETNREMIAELKAIHRTLKDQS